jgi:hypothetical protein
VATVSEPASRGHLSFDRHGHAR